MKIGKSTVQFNLTASLNSKYQPRYSSIAEVPLWALYARKGDCIGEGWKSTHFVTYDELINYLQRFNGHRVLEAYPRKNDKQNRSYSYDYDSVNNEFIVLDKHTGEVLYIVNSLTEQQVYLSPDYKTDYYFFRKFFGRKHRAYPQTYTWLANSLLNKQCNL